jgi:hypothetical protein
MESTAMDDFKFQAGDMVIVGQTFTSLAEIRRFVRETAAIEIGFEDDALGEAWPLPLEGGLVTNVRLLKNLFELTQGEVHEVGYLWENKVRRSWGFTLWRLVELYGY